VRADAHAREGCAANSPERLLTVFDVAELTQLHPEVVRREIRRGHLRATILCRRLRISPSDLQVWIDANRSERVPGS
jgi:excisionase family DNA binding protein